MKALASDHGSLLERRLDGFDLSVRAANCLRYGGVETIGALVAMRSMDLAKWPNVGRKTLAEIRNFLGGMGLKLSDDQVPSETNDEQRLSTVAEPTAIEEELHSIIRAVNNERDTQILVKLWGWNGKAPRTLESVAREFAITRERVRQIEKRSILRIQKRGFKTHLLDSAIAILRDATPESASTLSTKLREHGISGTEFEVKSVQRATEILGIEWPFEFTNFRSERILTLTGEGEQFRKLVALLKRKTSDRGCANFLSLASEVGIEERKLPNLKRVLAQGSRVEWLDDSQEWLYSLESTRNRLLNICLKVLGVAPRVHLSELRRAVSRSRRMAMCPPQRVLGVFVERCGLGRVEDSVVKAKRGRGKAPAEDSAEGIMIRVLDEFGPAMDGEEFAEKCIAAGMNAITFYIYRTSSSVICALGKNVFCKVGTYVPPGTVEDIVSRRRVVARVSDHGWTANGRLWCGRELSRQVITSGGVRLPTFVADFVQGNWQVVLPDGSACGAVTCRDVFIWSLRKAFAILGAEPTDLAVLEFDLKTREVLLRVGGPGLFEAIQEPESGNAEEGLEDAVPPA